jgi:hypothetical protein
MAEVVRRDSATRSGMSSRVDSMDSEDYFSGIPKAKSPPLGGDLLLCRAVVCGAVLLRAAKYSAVL